MLQKMNNENLKKRLITMNDQTGLATWQEYIDLMRETRGFTKDTPQNLMLFLTEEMGELAKEVRKLMNFKLDVSKTRESDIDGEIADIFIYLLSLCNILDINLAEAVKEKEERNCQRKWE